MPAALVFGARNVGRAVVGERLAAGWGALAVARTEETLARVRDTHPGALTMVGDAADPKSVAEAIDRAERELGGLDLVVNATGGGHREGPFGGGPVAEAPADRLEAWMEGSLPPAWQVMRLGARALAARGAGRSSRSRAGPPAAACRAGGRGPRRSSPGAR
jgi:NAD(P)-dependent dehydrogenase (short-subunit alcohol dehydrogenase family)